MTRFKTLCAFVVALSLSWASIVVRAADDDDDSDRVVLHATLSACPAGGAGNNIGDVNVCGLAWTIKRGSALLTADGSILVKVRGLVINDTGNTTFNGTPDGVNNVYATLICGANANRVAVASTGLFPIDRRGNARIGGKISVPAGCIAPAILVREADFPGQGWLAATGF